MITVCKGCRQLILRSWTPADPSLADYHAGCRPGAGRIPSTRRCAAWIGCGNLAVPVADLSFRGFCPECEAVANGSDDAGEVATRSLPDFMGDV